MRLGNAVACFTIMLYDLYAQGRGGGGEGEPFKNILWVFAENPHALILHILVDHTPITYLH